MFSPSYSFSFKKPVALEQRRDPHQQPNWRTIVRSGAIRWLYIGLLFAICASIGTAQSNQPFSDASGQPHAIKTVFVILMENHNWVGDRFASIKANEHASYINDVMARSASYASNYWNPPHIHPSEPNYLWLEAGTNFGILNNGNPYQNHQSTHLHLVHLLEQKGISWRAYDERASGRSCTLRTWHTPFVFFDDVTNKNDLQSQECIQHLRPLAQLKGDLGGNKTARYNFIVPNGCHSMHDVCNGENPITDGDRWLASIVPEILNSHAYRDNGVLFVVWDEANIGDGPIPMFVLSPLAKGNGFHNNTRYTHGSILRTVQEIFGVTPLLRDAAKEQDLRDLFIQFP